MCAWPAPHAAAAWLCRAVGYEAYSLASFARYGATAGDVPDRQCSNK
jgi:hypothetical protein